ncbi:hypothetical protein GCM10027186_34910 [Micromonospora schwarzwaldensis]
MAAEPGATTGDPPSFPGVPGAWWLLGRTPGYNAAHPPPIPPGGCHPPPSNRTPTPNGPSAPVIMESVACGVRFVTVNLMVTVAATSGGGCAVAGPVSGGGTA